MQTKQLILLVGLLAAAFLISNVASTPAPAAAAVSTSALPQHVLNLRRRGLLGDVW